MNTISQKQELVDWLTTVTDEKVLLEIKSIKHRANFNFDQSSQKV